LWKRGRHRPIAQGSTTVVHHAQSVGPDWPVVRTRKALNTRQGGRAVNRLQVKRADDFGYTAAQPLELNQERHGILRSPRVFGSRKFDRMELHRYCSSKY
jgi:hypothetical protein